jgi:hypothetical protein
MGVTQRAARRLVKDTLPEASKWSFARLFDAGEVGVIYDPSDLSTLYQDAAGTTPVTTPGQPVGLILDKSKQTAFSTEPVRNLVAWTEEFENAFWIKHLSTVAANNATDPLDNNVADTWTPTGQYAWVGSPMVTRALGQYTVSIWARVASGTRVIHIGIQENGAYLLVSPITITTTWQRFTATLNHTNAAFTIRFLFQDRNASGFIPIEIWGAQLESGSSMTAYQKIEQSLPGGIWHGRHASQAAAASRPTYGVVPKGVRRNLLRDTNDFTSSWWLKSSAGTLNGSLWSTTTGVNGDAFIEGFMPLMSPNTLTASAIVKPNVTGVLTTQFEIDAYQTGTAGGARYGRFNLDTNTVVTASNCTAGLTPLSDGSKLVWITYPAEVLSGANRIRFCRRFSLTGDNSSVFVYSVQAEIGQTPTDHQYVGASFDSRRNLVGNTENLTTTPWSSAAISRVISSELVNGLPATLLTVNSTGAVKNLTHSAISILANRRYHMSITVKQGTHSEVMFGYGAPSSWSVRCRFSFVTQSFIVAFTNSGNIWQAKDWSVTKNRDGSFTIRVVVWATTDASGNIFVNLSTGNNPDSSTPIGSSVLVSAPQFEVGESPTAYQRVNGVNNITEMGAETSHYLQFDGVDDWLSTPAVNFSGTDKMTIATGVRKLSSTTWGVMHELSNNANNNAGSFYLLDGSATAVSAQYAALARGTASATVGQAAASTISFTAPISNVVVVTHDIIGDLSAMRVNSAANGTNGTSDKGAGNFGNYPLFMGRRGGTTMPHNGQLFGLVARGALSSISEVQQTEKLMANKTSGITFLATYDPDAQDYFNRVAAAGGSFTSSSYSDVFTRTSINRWFATVKDLGLWNKLHEVYLFVGPTFPGILSKLKHAGTPSLTNNNFVTGDYVQVGTGAGLKGNGSDKNLVPGINTTSIINSLSAYITEADTRPSNVTVTYVSSRTSSFIQGIGQFDTGTAEVYTSGNGAPAYARLLIARRDGFLVGTSRADNDRELYRNGISIATSTNSTSLTTGSAVNIFRTGGTNEFPTNARIAFAHVGNDGLTADDAATLSTATNALMAALGANVY